MEMTSVPTDATRTIVFADPPGSNHYVTAEVPISAMNEDIMDTAFMKAVGCDGFPGGCAAMTKYYRFASSVPLGEHWKHKYLVDFDGMSYSGRAFSFLASESVLVKSTVYREFYSDWIQPWCVTFPWYAVLAHVLSVTSQAALYSPFPIVSRDL